MIFLGITLNFYGNRWNHRLRFNPLFPSPHCWSIIRSKFLDKINRIVENDGFVRTLMMILMWLKLYPSSIVDKSIRSQSPKEHPAELMQQQRQSLIFLVLVLTTERWRWRQQESLPNRNRCRLCCFCLEAPHKIPHNTDETLFPPHRIDLQRSLKCSHTIRTTSSFIYSSIKSHHYDSNSKSIESFFFHLVSYYQKIELIYHKKQC